MPHLIDPLYTDKCGRWRRSQGIYNGEWRCAKETHDLYGQYYRLYKFLTNIDEFIDNKHCHTQHAQWMDFNIIFFTGYKFILFCNICINYQLMFVTRR